MYEAIKADLEKLAGEDPVMANKVSAIILEKMAADQAGNSTPEGIAIDGAVDETALAGDVAARQEQEMRGEPDELAENVEAVSAPEEVPATAVAEAFMAERTAAEAHADLVKLATDEPELAEKLASAILELSDMPVPEKVATGMIETLEKAASESKEEAEKLASDILKNIEAEKIASEMLGKLAGFEPKTRWNEEFRSHGGVTFGQALKDDLASSAKGFAAGAPMGALAGAAIDGAKNGTPGRGALVGGALGAFAGQIAGSAIANKKLTESDRAAIENIVRDRMPEATEDEIRKATNKAVLFAMYPDKAQ